MTFHDEYHSLACERLADGTLACRCRPLRVRESRAGARANAYTSMTVVEAESDRMPNGVPVVLNPPPGRRSASSRLSR